MRIKILVSLATMSRVYERGDVAEWPDAEDARRLIKAGYAEPAADDRQQQPGKGRA